MPKRTGLGELEQLVLLAILRLGESAYGVPIEEEIRVRTGRSLSPGTLYPTLARLEEKGFVRSWMGDPTSERGGRAKRFFAVEAEGLRELRRAWQQFTSLGDGLEGILEGEVG